MSDFQFISYKATPEDSYGMLGIVTIRAYGKVVLRLKHVQGKDGKGIFFLPASYTITENGEKKYVKCFALDSMSDAEMLEDFVREAVKRHLSGGTTNKPQARADFEYPHGLIKNQNNNPAISEGSNYMPGEIPF